MRGMEAVQKFILAQKTCGRMWHAMRFARINLLELESRKFVSRKDLAEADEMIKSTRKLYFEALEALFQCERDLMQCDVL